MYLTQGLKRAVQTNSNGIATIDGQRQQSWSQFAKRVAKLAGAFKKLKLSEEGRIAILSLNSDRYLESFFATTWAGGIVMPLNFRLAPSELIYMLNDAGAEVLLVDDNFKDMLASFNGQLPFLKHVVFVGEGPTPEGTFSYEDILDDAKTVPDVERGGDDILGIFYTGGTTGVPKGVMLTHDNFVSNAMSVLALTYKGTAWTCLHTAPMFHMADCQANCVVTIQAGTHVFLPRFDPETTLKAIQTHRVTHSMMVPTMVNLLVNFPNVSNYDVSSLQEVIYGGSSMPPALISKTNVVFPDCEFSQGYGLTETSPGISLFPSQNRILEGPLSDKLNSAGQPVFDMEVKIVDENDSEVPLGKIGEITTRGPHVMAGYWNKPEETAKALRSGWLHTGDMGYIDEEGFIFIVDRLKEMIITGGENVYSTEVENAIYQHPAVAMCAVIGIPSEKWGETIHAIITLKENLTVTEEEIIQHCQALIAGYKCPRSIEVRQEPMPMSGAGKILKKELRIPFWKG